MQKKIVVVGGGYVGQITAVGLADIGNSVVLVDINTQIIELLSKGKSHLHESGLEALIQSTIKQKTISFSSSVADSLAEAYIVFIAVQTPVNAKGVVNLDAIYSVSKSIAPHIQSGTIIITKSTVPVGTNHAIKKIIAQRAPHIAFAVVSNPEFLQEGRVVQDFYHPKRIVIGYENKAVQRPILDMYRHFVQKKIPILWTSIATAELAKYASNAFLATRVALINQFAALSENIGADINEISEFLQMDERIGGGALRAGPGFGGSCLPKDCRAVIALGKKIKKRAHIIEAVVKTNKKQQKHVLHKVRGVVGGVRRKTIAILGLAFKANTNDVRESVSIHLVSRLRNLGAHVRVHDPQALEMFRKFNMQKIMYCNTAHEAYQGADALIILTEWDEYKTMNLEAVKHAMHTPIIIDMRNILNKDAAQKLGITYVGIGR